MDHKSNLRRILRYLLGPSDIEEADQLSRLPEVESILLQQWEHPEEVGGSFEAPNRDRMLAGIYRKIASKNVLLPPSAAKSFWRGYRWAASILLPIAIASLLIWKSDTFKSTEIAYANPKGVRSAFYLPDGSRIWLNADSRLSFSQSGNIRKVSLTGEAYFKVKTDHAHPMVVSANGISVTVTGTEFNLSAYPEEGIVEASLIHGVIAMKRLNPKEGMLKSIKVLPGQSVIYQDGKFYSRQLGKNEHFEWRDGKIEFDNTNLDEVIRKLQRWFNVSITLSDPSLKEYCFTGSFDNETATDILTLFGKTAPIAYTVDKKTEQITIYRTPN